MSKKRAKSREGMIILSVALPPELHRKLALAALDERASMNELIRLAVADYLRARRASRKAEKG
jgi:predicted HicB family RNase H-like nuclease